VLAGGGGDDGLNGGQGLDAFDAGPGRDLVEARDGTRETVRCGPGQDTARVDAADRTIGCEQRT